MAHGLGVRAKQDLDLIFGDQWLGLAGKRFQLGESLAVHEQLEIRRLESLASLAPVLKQCPGEITGVLRQRFYCTRETTVA